MHREQAIGRLVAAAEGWLWFDNNVEPPEEDYSKCKAYELAKDAVVSEVVNAIHSLRVTTTS